MARPPMHVWTAEEARQFLDATAEDRHAVLWALMLSTGLRRGEVLGLRWDDVDLAGGRLSVTKTVVVAAPSTTASRTST